MLTTVFPPISPGATIRVGPTRELRTIRAAAEAASDGDLILIDAGVYRADVAMWVKNDLVVLAEGGRAQLIADGANEGGKGIWVVEGRNFTAENIEFSGAKVPDQNGAGIRLHAKGTVSLKNCSFHDNEDGILGEADQIIIENCVFDHNGAGDGQSHNLYVWGPSVTIRYCYIHRAVVGHNIKTRGETNYILYNRIMDEADGTGSYAIDVSDCGRTYIIGNVIEQGPRTENEHLVSYGPESAKNVQDLYVVNNTFVNNGPAEGAFLKCRDGTRARVVNNIFYGPGTPWVGGTVKADHNYVSKALNNAPKFLNQSTYDFHLTSGSPPAIVNAGVSPGASSTGYDLAPKYEYVYDAWGTARLEAGAPDIGAFEYRDIGRH